MNSIADGQLSLQFGVFLLRCENTLTADNSPSTPEAASKNELGGDRVPRMLIFDLRPFVTCAGKIASVWSKIGPQQSAEAVTGGHESVTLGTYLYEAFEGSE